MLAVCEGCVVPVAKSDGGVGIVASGPSWPDSGSDVWLGNMENT